MERFNFIKNGMLRLPPGFRFHPTDQELVVQYLRRKVYDCPLPASIIPEFDVCRSDPWDLPGDWEQERYFFSTKEAKYPNGNRANRATVSGYWKATGIDKPVLAVGNKNRNQVVGMKKSLVFYRGKPPRGSKTDWIMHEYRLATAADNIPTQDANAARGNWVLCRIFLKRRNDCPMIDTFRINSTMNRYHHNNLNANNDGENNRGSRVRNDRPILFDFTGSGSDDKSGCPVIDTRKMVGSNAVVQATSSSSSSSGSSGVTDVSDRDEGSSCSNSFPYFAGKSIQNLK